jgi:hypothetical protein
MVLRSSLSRISVVVLSQLRPRVTYVGNGHGPGVPGTATPRHSHTTSSIFSPLLESGTVLDIFGSAGENKIVLDRLADHRAVSLGFLFSRRLAWRKATASQRIEFPPIALAIRPGSFGLRPWI